VRLYAQQLTEATNLAIAKWKIELFDGGNKNWLYFPKKVK
jgi:hypothetical protein